MNLPWPPKRIHWVSWVALFYTTKTVKCEVINVEFLSRDLPLSNSEIMVKWKCMKLLYSSKGMWRIDSQFEKLIRLKYLILETPYTFFFIFSWYFRVLHTLNFLSPMFSGNDNKFFFFCLFQSFLFVFVFNTLKKKIFIFKYFQHWFNTVPSQSVLISQEVFVTPRSI